MASKKTLLIAALILTTIFAATQVAFAANETVTEIAGEAIEETVGKALPGGLASGILWGGLVFAFKKFLGPDSRNTKWETRNFLTTLLVGITASAVAAFTGKTMDETQVFIASFGLTAILDKLVGEIIKHWNAVKK